MLPTTAVIVAATDSAHALASWSCCASTTPAANSSESPGRNRPTMNAHSANTNPSTIAQTMTGPADSSTPVASTPDSASAASTTSTAEQPTGYRRTRAQAGTATV